MKTKFKCRNCNKEYQDLLGAIGCPCKDKIEWNKPSGKLTPMEKYLNEK